MLLRSGCLSVILGLAAITQASRGQVREQDDAQSLRSPQSAAESSASIERPEVAQAIIERTNRFRARKGRAEVDANARLLETAQYFADYMARTDRYGHTADGQRPSQRAREHGYEYCIVSENIAYQYSSRGFEQSELIERFMHGWKTSPGHRKNMLDPDVTETGVAVAQSEATGYIYAVQMFGRPKSASIGFEVANQSGETVHYQIGDRTFPLPPRYTRTHEICRPTELTFTWRANDERRSKSFEPQDGDRFVATKPSGKLQFRRGHADPL
jgi:uncharacterized protein YkwD